MIHSTMTTFALAMLLLLAPLQQCQGLALIPRAVRTALVGRFAAPAVSRSSPVASPAPPASLYAHSQRVSDSMDIVNDIVESTEQTLGAGAVDYDDDVAAYRNEMLNLVYERSMERLMN